MTITLKELNIAQDALGKLLNAPIDAKLAYRARKIIGKIITEIGRLEEEKLELIKKHGGVSARDQLGREFLKVPDDKLTEYNKEFKELLKIEVDLGGEKIPFECVDRIQLSLQDMSILEKFIEEQKA